MATLQYVFLVLDIAVVSQVTQKPYFVQQEQLTGHK